MRVSASQASSAVAGAWPTARLPAIQLPSYGNLQWLPGSSPTAGEIKDGTPLHFAVASGNSELVTLLLEHGADVNAKTTNGWTPLHSAVERRDLEMARLLLDAKADPDAKDTSGRTPLALAMERGDMRALGGRRPGGAAVRESVVELLRERGAKDPPEPKPTKTFETDPEKAKAGGKAAFFGAVRGNGLQGNLFALKSGVTTSLAQALLEVGFAENADMSRVRLTRLNPETKESETKTVDLRALKRGGSTEEILLQDGDRVEVPKQSE